MSSEKDSAKRTFCRNLNILLAEKGLRDTPDSQIAEMINQTWQGQLVGAKTVTRWRDGLALPTYTVFGLLADWLDCEETDLLPVKQQECLRGFWQV